MWWLLIALSGEADAGKAERQARRELREVKRHTQVLTDATDEYWRALRWADYTRAAGHMVDAQARAEWVIDQTEEPDFKIQNAEVLSIQVGPVLPDEPYARRASVLVQIEAYPPKTQTLKKDTRVQTWTLTHAGWVVLPGDEYGSSTRER